MENLILNALTIIPEDALEGDPIRFLGKAVDPPEKESIEVAIQNLLDIGALEALEGGNKTDPSTTAATSPVQLTGLGKHLSRLPVDAKIGKLLIFGALFQCLDATLTIAATASERSPFSSPFDKRDEARKAKESFAWGKSDLLMFVKVFNEWRDLREKPGNGSEVHTFMTRNFLLNKTMWSIMDGRKQLADSLAETGLCGSDQKQKHWERSDELNIHSDNERVIQAVICAGLYPNIVRLDMQQKYKKVHGGAIAVGGDSKDIKLRGKSMERLFLHPESINFFEGNYSTRWLAYFTKVLTSKPFIRDSTMVSPYALLLFGGMIEVLHEKGQISVDKWIVFKSPARVGILARELRKQLDMLLVNKFEDASIDIASNGRAVTDAIIKLLSTETYQF